MSSGRARRVQGWRKLAGAAWGRPMDPQFYGDLELDAGAMLGYIEEVRRVTGVHLTITHLAGRAVAHGLAAVPELRVRLARGRAVRPVLTLTATFDHRYVDGFHAARFAQAVRSYCAAPAGFEPPLTAGPDERQGQRQA